jgi:hypothetical protein
MDKEQQLKEKAERLASLPSSKNPVQKLEELLKNETDLDISSRVVAFFYIAAEERLCGQDGNKFIYQARKLINTYPLPDNAEEQLERFINLSTNEDEKFELEHMREIMYRCRNKTSKPILK